MIGSEKTPSADTRQGTAVDPAGPVSNGPAALVIYRILLWTLVVTATLGVLLVNAPTPDAASGDEGAARYAIQMTSARADFDANDELAESAPQQQVVNGWYTNRLLEIVTEQNVDLLRTSTALADSQRGSAQPELRRLTWMLGIIVLGVSGHVLGDSVIAARSARIKRDRAPLEASAQPLP